jgi:hypothetical protein
MKKYILITAMALITTISFANEDNIIEETNAMIVCEKEYSVCTESCENIEDNTKYETCYDNCDKVRIECEEKAEATN